MANCSNCNDNVNRCGEIRLTNPCTYTNCSVGNERCHEVQDAACVTYGGHSFTIGDTNALLAVDQGERLDSIIQKFANMITNGLGACNSDDVNHNPFNVYLSGITKMKLQLYGMVYQIQVVVLMYMLIHKAHHQDGH